MPKIHVSDTTLSAMPTVVSTVASTAGHLSLAVATTVVRAVDNPMGLFYSPV